MSCPAIPYTLFPLADGAMLVRRLLALALLALLAACSGNITAADDQTENRGGTMVTSGG